MPVGRVNPTTGELIKWFEPRTDGQRDAKHGKAAETFPRHRDMPFAERAQLVCKPAVIQEDEAYARVMTTEIGKPFRSAVNEATKCTAKNAESLLADEIIETSGKRSYVRFSLR